MSKSTSRDASTPFSGIFPMASMPAMKPEAIVESYGKLLDQMRVLNQSWMNTVQQTLDSNWELASQLTKCGDPAEAITVCKEWANERRDALLAEGKTLSSLCLKLYQNDGPSPANQPTIASVRAAAGD
jgi:hypothetical protein